MSCNASSRVFVGEDGRPLKFRIQPNLDLRVRQTLESRITKYGGTVISNVPVRGFVVVDPDSVVGKALIGEWAWVERPDRRFVSTAYVKNCVDAKSLLPTEDVWTPRMALARKTTFITSSVSDSDDFIRPPLSDEQKVKLAHYLTEIPLENRTSNQVFRNLVDKASKFPWVNGSPWQAFRNSYCKHKRWYDKKIKELSKQKEQAFLKDKCIDLRNPSLNTHSTRKTSKTGAKSALSQGSVKHIDLSKVPATSSRSETKGPATRCSEKSPVEEPMDLDDMRSSSFLLNAAVAGDRQDEDDCFSLLFSSRKRHDEPGFPPTSANNYTSRPHNDDDAFSEALAKETRLTVDEVKQKLAGFSGDRSRAKEFLFRCRQMMDDFFIQSFDGPSSISQA